MRSRQGHVFSRRLSSTPGVVDRVPCRSNTSCSLILWKDIRYADQLPQKLLEKIDQSRDKAVTFLRDMVVIPSVTGDEAEIQKFLSKYMTKIGLEVDMWETDWEELKKHPGIPSCRPGI